MSTEGLKRFWLGLIFGSLITASAFAQGRFLPVIKSQSDFDSLAVVYDPNTPYALPHALFVIDRQNKNRVYYVNTKLYKFHKDFVNGTYLSLERGEDFFQNNYLKPNRRFILGTIAFQTPVRKWTLEFWEGDLIPPDQIKLAYDLINQSFFTPVAYKPNSSRQEEASANLEIPRVLQTEITKGQDYQPLNVAKGLGRIHVIPKLDDHVEIGFNEILVLDEVPIQLPPVAGIITSKPSTPLSHINLLAKGWNRDNFELELAKLQAALEVTPRNVYIDADANQGWRSAQWTVSVLQRFEGYDNLSMEQPLPYADLEGAAFVRAHSRVPVIMDDPPGHPKR